MKVRAMEYMHPLRRRARGSRQIITAAMQLEVMRRGLVVGAYWWDVFANFGDDLTPWLLPKYGLVPMHRRVSEAQLVGVGSIIGALPPGYSGAIWGSGLSGDRAFPLPNAHVLAVRGHLTRERIGANEGVALGDPGLLVSRRIRRPAPRWDVGIVPHAVHRSHVAFGLLARSEDLRVRVVNVHQTASRAVREIAACNVIVTTSLHGLVTADAFGIPALWTSLEPTVYGGGFKFRDYESVVTPDSSRFVAFDERVRLQELIAQAASAPRSTVDAASDALEAALRRLPEALGGLLRFPGGIPQMIRGRPDSASRPA
jgi:hypothetical protein